MALGGGVFVTQNKVLPGTYMNFVSASLATGSLSDRGYVAMAMELDWGVDGEVFTVNAEDFKSYSLKIFGYDYGSEQLKGLRDLFRNSKTGYFYKLNSGGVKASNTYATALHGGTRGNALTIAIENNELSTEDNQIYDVTTLVEGRKVDVQTVKNMGELKDNNYVTFNSTATLELTVGTPLAGGTNGTVENGSYQTFLDKIESYAYNTLGCLSTDPTVKAIFAAFTKRMRDSVGLKFQCVLHKYAEADYEGVISVENNAEPDLVYWVTGAAAGCAVNAVITNKVYDGEFTVDANYTQSQLEAGIKAGKLMLHKVGDTVRILEDLNTFVSFTADKSGDFAGNQTIRVLDQIANDIAYLFNTKYLGQLPNDNAGRISLWNDIVKHHQELEKIRAIENFKPEDVTVEQGESKKAVVVRDYVTPLSAMTQLYMTVIVS